MDLTIAPTIFSAFIIATESFQPVMVSSSIGDKRSSSSSSSTSSQLNYMVYGEDRVKSANTRTSKKNKKAPVKTIKSNNTKNYDHGYIVSNHDDERSFWLHALQNLESSSTSPPSNQALWTTIANAYAPMELTSAASRIPKQEDASVVRVGDTDLDIAIPVPSGSWDPSTLNEDNVISATNEARTNHHLVTIRVDFPEGSSFDKNALSFEDELIAVIEQVRLLEQTANDRLSKV